MSDTRRYTAAIDESGEERKHYVLDRQTGKLERCEDSIDAMYLAKQRNKAHEAAIPRNIIHLDDYLPHEGDLDHE